MRALVMIAAIALVLVAGLSVPADAIDPIGPLCLRYTPFDNFPTTLYALPMGGGQLLLTGTGFGASFTGSAFVNGNQLVLSLFSANDTLNPGITFRAVLDTGTLQGSGRCSIIDAGAGTTGCGAGTDLTYSVTGGPC